MVLESGPTDEPTFTEAVAELRDVGPGGICEDCGHFACRHDGARCHFPRPAGNACNCGGMLWQGHRLAMNCQAGPVAAASDA